MEEYLPGDCSTRHKDASIYFLIPTSSFQVGWSQCPSSSPMSCCVWDFEENCRSHPHGLRRVPTTSRFSPSLTVHPSAGLGWTGRQEWTRSWEQTQPGQSSQTDQRDIPRHRRPCSAKKSFMAAGGWRDISGHSVCLQANAAQRPRERPIFCTDRTW